jgi:hypothetical protein
MDSMVPSGVMRAWNRNVLLAWAALAVLNACQNDHSELEVLVLP